MAVDRQCLCSYRHFPTVKRQILQRIPFVSHNCVPRACTHHLLGCRYPNHLVTFLESEAVYPLVPAPLVGLVERIAHSGSTHTALAPLTVCLGFRSSTHQLRNRTLGMLRTYLSSQSTNILCLLDQFAAERLHYVRCRFLLHPRLQRPIHLSLSPHWNMLPATREHHPERSGPLL